MEKSLMWGTSIFFGLVIILVAITLIYGIGYKEVRTFESCVEKGGYLILESYPRQCSYKGDTYIEIIKDGETTIYDYFLVKIREKGVQNTGGMPKEGFDPIQYMGAFPKLEPEDFNGAKAVGGEWNYQNGNLTFIKDPLQKITSADGTVSDIGLTMLLENLKYRLDLRILGPEDIDTLITFLLEEDKQYCTKESREVDVCVQIYDPVCGKPLNKTFSNSCSACKNDGIDYWVSEKC